MNYFSDHKIILSRLLGISMDTSEGGGKCDPIRVWTFLLWWWWNSLKSVDPSPCKLILSINVVKLLTPRHHTLLTLHKHDIRCECRFLNPVLSIFQWLPFGNFGMQSSFLTSSMTLFDAYQWCQLGYHLPSRQLDLKITVSIQLFCMDNVLTWRNKSRFSSRNNT